MAAFPPIPLIDWNGNGQIDHMDIAQFLAMNEAAAQEAADDEDDDE